MFNYTFHVQLVARSFEKKPAMWVSENGEIPIVHRAKRASGLLVTVRPNLEWIEQMV